ncbi:hypothetical protein Aau02nite_24980 [Amorphoplanes auranticolor]|uniref:Uncharacterized protein n=1 Tax=Actinoplanes auranticolor TaxID=47988 RepID=A0A919VID3_9ACTN|nr:hypothetical protein Aau02nite_24980 [Actinoplanes auranticolor]
MRRTLGCRIARCARRRRSCTGPARATGPAGRAALPAADLRRRLPIVAVMAAATIAYRVECAEPVGVDQRAGEWAA